MEQCIICTQKVEKDDHLVSPQTYVSWQAEGAWNFEAKGD